MKRKSGRDEVGGSTEQVAAGSVYGGSGPEESDRLSAVRSVFRGHCREESGGRTERGARCSGAETGIRRPAEGTDFRAGDGNRARGKRTESRDRGTGSEWNEGRRRSDGKGVQANPLSRSYEVNVGIQTKNTGLLPGMVTEVWLQDADKSQACVLPANVLQLDEHNNYFVWLKGADGKASKRVVACGKFTATGVTVVNGLNEGDEVIVEGQQKVCEGTPLAL